MTTRMEDDGLDDLRRDLMLAVLNEAGKALTRDPQSPLGLALSEIVRSELQQAMDAATRSVSGIDARAVADQVVARIGSQGGADPAARVVDEVPAGHHVVLSRRHAIMLLAGAIALAIFMGALGYVLGGRGKVPAPAVSPSSATISRSSTSTGPQPSSGDAAPRQQPTRDLDADPRGSNPDTSLFTSDADSRR